MNITIKKSRDDNKRKTIWLPMEEDKLEEVCNELGIEMTTEPNSYIESSMDERFLNILTDKNVNIDELNYLMKRFDGFDSREMNRFYAVAFAEEYSSMADLINLSFNMHCYSLINNFSDFNKIGKDLYLTQKMAVSSKELDELDGEAYAMDVIENNQSARVTPYGVLYRNVNQPEQVYDGKHFPPNGWKKSMATVELSINNESEFIYLPCSDIEIEKALMRLGVPYLQDCEINIDNHELPDKVLDMIPKELKSMERIDTLNKVANKFIEMKEDIKYFERLMDYVNPKTIDEVLLLGDLMYEFELFYGIKDAEDYGRYMICDSGHFEYDHNLEDYIDFKRYGQVKMNNEIGAFTDKGYIIYHGYNQKLSKILSENLGMKMSDIKEQKVMRLYIPLTVTTYEIENDYGYRETLNEPLELSNYEIASYIDEILEAIERDSLPEEIHRGLMHYYDYHDSVNAKVAKYEFSVEMVEDELMGVAVLTLNEDLNKNELEKIKDYITGQASSKYALTEILICEECGHPYRRQVWSKYGQKSAVWRCENRLKNRSISSCKHSPTLKEEQVHDAIMKAINSIVGDTGDFIGAFRENVIRIIGSHSTKKIPSEYDEKIDLLQKEMLGLIEENAKLGAVTEYFDDEYKRISEEINQLKKAKLSLIQEKK
ncbi:recombinase zinc beta ribbon domain-containing protein [Tissierella praeacuta]|uniref:recombinase zinc beta ribbon domain-containing protein n=1 Tax=Tissierella praeacuta TaxID=43131 RepID=UPI0028A68328|nr:recombinase zinc beta ribbon domain-containing protein [Tissierella praeacuta]